MHQHIYARHFNIKGLVQGVGFRPAVYRIAKEFGLKGWVNNSNEGVQVHVEGGKQQIEAFIEKLKKLPPLASTIISVEEIEAVPKLYSDFSIQKSEVSSNDITQVSPDIAVCEQCLEDMKKQPHRVQYAFTNCTHCGPRFTIIKNLPYDREQTTMAPFSMCETCRQEYETVTNRRFHAQPIACKTCGPTYTLHEQNEQIEDIDLILERLANLVDSGGIIAIKGLGGYHLMCDAKNDHAVERLRELKLRDEKPFAVMVKDVESANKYAHIKEAEKTTLASWRRPIVLLEGKSKLAEGINSGVKSIGLMLPYMPIHHMMFERFKTDAIVLTSGNLTDDPIIIENEQALKEFKQATDAVLTYNREIHNRADDSVVFVANEKPRLIRRSRGYVPEPVRLSFSADGILGVGAELSHSFALGKGNQVLMSQHIGDLKDPKTYSFFEESVSRMQHLFRMKPEVVACDLHPDYLSTRYAKELNLPVIEVQHHHAHIAAAMAEFNLDEPVLGVCWDGTGLGTDGNIWGGEFLYADLNSFERFSHFEYLPLPGGDKAAFEPWRMAVSYLYQVYGDGFLDIKIPFIQYLKQKEELELVLQSIDRKLNTPLSSAAGRLFDAVAALTNTCQLNSFHAEAPMKLEAMIDKSVQECYRWEHSGDISFSPVIRTMVEDLRAEVPVSAISAKFHNTLISVIHTEVRKMKDKYGTQKVILSGGVFQNKYLLEETEKRLADDFKVFSPHLIPANDAGIALGQLAVAAKKLNLKS